MKLVIFARVGIKSEKQRYVVATFRQTSKILCRVKQKKKKKKKKGEYRNQNKIISKSKAYRLYVTLILFRFFLKLSTFAGFSAALPFTYIIITQPVITLVLPNSLMDCSFPGDSLT